MVEELRRAETITNRLQYCRKMLKAHVGLTNTEDDRLKDKIAHLPDTFKALQREERKKIKEKVLKVVCKVLDVDDLDLKKELRKDLDADSLDEVEIWMALESEFGIELKDEEVKPCKTTQDILELIYKQGYIINMLIKTKRKFTICGVCEKIYKIGTIHATGPHCEECGSDLPKH